MTGAQWRGCGAQWRKGCSADMSVGQVLVTGGSSGLGEAVAAAVLSRGGMPLILDRRPPRLQAPSVCVDLADTEAVNAAVAQLCSGGELSGVVTAAGIDSCGRLDDVDAKEWEQVIAVNLVGTAAVIRAALPMLLATHGRIVTVASTLGIRAVGEATAYCASKFGVVGFTRALAAELAGEVGVTCLIPGGMHTAFFDGRAEKYKPPPDARLNRPEDVAETVVFALTQPPGCEIRELVVCASTEASWP